MPIMELHDQASYEQAEINLKDQGTHKGNNIPRIQGAFSENDMMNPGQILPKE